MHEENQNKMYKQTKLMTFFVLSYRCYGEVYSRAAARGGTIAKPQREVPIRAEARLA